MECFLCGKKIGWFRRLVDQQYCSSEHRHQARFVSARALRDAEDEGEEPWSVIASRKKAAVASSGATAGQTASIFAFLAIAVMVIAVLALPSGAGGGGGGQAPSMEQGKPAGLFSRAGDAVASAIRSSAPVSLREDFRGGLRDWSAATVRVASGPGRSDGDAFGGLGKAGDYVKPGTLRLWKRSMSMTNYQMEFLGQIEKKSVAWAFRASDGRNYYGGKLTMTKPAAGMPNAGLVRYAMIDGRESDRTTIPLPVTLEPGGSYRIRVNVQDDRFLTYLNGQVISSWSDKRLKRGGVGFLAEDGDASTVKWVTLSERDSFLGRVIAYFSLIQMPGLDLE